LSSKIPDWNENRISGVFVLGSKIRSVILISFGLNENNYLGGI
jgi:hypothetical protein